MKSATQVLLDAARPRPSAEPSLLDAIRGRPLGQDELEMSPAMARQWAAQAEFRLALRLMLGGDVPRRAEA